MTIEWINPGALLALIAVAGPFAVHLLRRRRATRVPFPTLRFVLASQSAAVRWRRPTDRRLMILRMLIVATAALAWAQPVVVTSGGDQRRDIARAIVIDTSTSAAVAQTGLREAAAAEHQGAVGRESAGAQERVITIPAPDLRDGLRQATHDLAQLAADRREIVVISDFQHGSVDDFDIARIPRETGLRFVAIGGGPPPSGSRPTLSLLPIDPTNPRVGHVTLDGPRTGLTISGDQPAGARPRIITAPEAAADAARLLRIVARAGAPSPRPERPVAIAFSGALLPVVTAPREDWMLRAVLRMRADAELRRAAWRSTQAGLGSLEGSWVPVTTDRALRTVVAVAAHDQELVVHTLAQPSDLLAAIALRAVLTATTEPPVWGELEPERLPAAQLTAWTRPPADLPTRRRTFAPPGQARWVWTLVLALLAIERAYRRTMTASRPVERSAHAA
jgi:hypothetical protein